MDRTCTPFYLEMTSPDALREQPQRPDPQIVECEVPQPELNRFLYGLAGACMGSGCGGPLLGHAPRVRLVWPWCAVSEVRTRMGE